MIPEHKNLISQIAPKNGQAAESKPGDRPVTLLRRAITNYEELPHRPELATQRLFRFWEKMGDSLGKKFRVDDLECSTDKLRKMERSGIMPFFMPNGFAGLEGLVLLERMLPNIHVDYSGIEGFKIADLANTGYEPGWWGIEASPETPHRFNSEEQALKLFEPSHRKILDVPTYLAASGFMAEAYDDHFDSELSFTMLKLGERTVRAGFTTHDGINELHLFGPVNPTETSEYLGARSKVRL